MPAQVSEEAYRAILGVVGRHPDGASVADLFHAPELDLTRRTLSRRLRHLVAEGRLVADGQTRRRRYFLPAPEGRTTETARPGLDTVVTQDGWLTDEARIIRDAVARPVDLRTPTGYQIEFLRSYEPNASAYLSVDIRVHLANVGQVGLTDLPAGTYLRQVLNRLLIDLSWNSSRLEGNTYSLLETQRLIDLGESAEGKAAEETQMILNHKAAIEMLAEQAEEVGFNQYTILNLHALLSDNLLADPAAGGRLRRRAVAIGGSVYHPLEVPQTIEECFDEILEKASAIEDPFERAFFVMVHLPYLQPFEDVNKRVSRLAANLPLIEHNLCPLSFIDVSRENYLGALLGVYELNRVEYLRDVFVRAYERSAARYAAVRQSLGDPDPFRLRYRSEIGRFVRAIVQEAMNKVIASIWIQENAEAEIPEDDRPRFIQVVNVELDSLHEGNIARYRLRPNRFNEWKAGW